MSVRYLAIAAFCAALVFGQVQAQQNWPQWRGPAQNGISNATDLPVTWSESENIVWKTALPAWSGSTPIIWENRIFLTSPSAQNPDEQAPPPPPGGRRSRYGQARSPGGKDLYLLSLSRQTGEILWQQRLDTGNRLHRKGNSASPSPVTDGQHVWTVTGTGQVTALDFSGKILWQRNLQDDYGQFGLNWGYASSPLLHDGKLIVQVLHGMHTDDPSYIVAFDAQTGAELWKQERPTDAIMESPDAYTTPVLLHHQGEKHIVITGGDYVTGNDPANGKELWRAGGLNPDNSRNYRIVASPIAFDGLIYAPTRNKPLLVLKAGGSGMLGSDYLQWKWTGAGSPDVPTPACDGKLFYMVDDRGLVTALDAKSGDVVWGPQRTAQGIVSASPLVADGKIYITNEQAETTVLVAGNEYRQLATNTLDGSYTLSSPVAVGSNLFIRTSKFLYCIGERPE